MNVAASICRRGRIVARRSLAALSLLVAAFAGGYEGDTHQQITFLAARQFNACVGVDIPRLTPLEVRYIARANADQADKGFWRKLFRWNYYDRAGESGRFLWMVETRMNRHYAEVTERLVGEQGMAERFSDLGRVVNYLQDATSPAHVVPIYTGRWWRFSVTDRFNNYPVDVAALTAALAGDCTAVRGADISWQQLLAGVAERTIGAVQEVIPGLPVGWEAYWEFDEGGDGFGQYGVAGNSFGRRTEFPCRDTLGESEGTGTERTCILLDNDPLYRQFALARHREAVQATVAAMTLLRSPQTAVPVADLSPDVLELALAEPHPR